MEQIYKWIKITEVAKSPSGKTSIFDVETKDLTDLGKIKWNVGWRCYAFYPQINSFYEKDCLRDIAEFLENLKLFRKENEK